MKKHTILTALGGVLLAGTMAFSQEPNPQAQPTPIQNLEQRTQLTQQDANFQGVINDLLIHDVVQAHIDMSAPTSTYLKQIQGELEFRMGDKTKAREKLLESFAYAHRLCLALGMTYGNNTIPEQEFDNLGKKIVGLEHTISQLAQESYVDYLDMRVYTQVIEWGKIRTHEFKELFSASKRLESKGISQGDLNEKENRIEYLKKVYQEAFTPEEYLTHVQTEDTISHNIERALMSTVDRGIIHQETIKGEMRDISESAKRIRYGIFYGYFENRPTLPHQIR